MLTQDNPGQTLIHSLKTNSAKVFSKAKFSISLRMNRLAFGSASHYSRMADRFFSVAFVSISASYRLNSTSQSGPKSRL